MAPEEALELDDAGLQLLDQRRLTEDERHQLVPAGCRQDLGRDRPVGSPSAVMPLIYS